MYLGGILTVLSFPLWAGLFTPEVRLVGGTLLLLPGGIDGTTQLLGERESTNKLRIVTGLFLGVGVVLFAQGVVISLL
jgi:uncharacterized membrane protein